MRHKILDRLSCHLHPRVNLHDRHMSLSTTEGFYLVQPFAYLLFSNCTLRITLIMTRLTAERTSQLRQWLADEGFRSPTKAERQQLAFSLNCHEQQVRRSIKQLRYECGKSRTWGISTETEIEVDEIGATHYGLRNSNRLIVSVSTCSSRDQPCTRQQGRPLKVWILGKIRPVVMTSLEGYERCEGDTVRRPEVIS